VVVAAARVIGADSDGTIVVNYKNGAKIESVALTDGSLRKEFTYKIAGAITKVAPAAGQENTTVTITGSTLLGQGAKADSVTLAGVAATVVSNNNSMVVIKAGASGATAAGAVVITADTGAVVSKASTFGYVGVGNITSVTPESGQLGTKVTLVGTDLLAGGSSLSAASLAGIAVSKIEKETATEVVVVAARSEAAVTGDIVLSSANGASTTSSDGFKYVAKPVFTSVAPSNGQSGTSVTIVGTGLRSGASAVDKVTLSGVEAASITSENDVCCRRCWCNCHPGSRRRCAHLNHWVAGYRQKPVHKYRRRRNYLDCAQNRPGWHESHHLWYKPARWR
jgi:multimeric flavodoxin WrbA